MPRRVAVALAVAGTVEWRMMSPSIAAIQASCSGRALLGCGFAYPPPHRLYPLRAELVWAAAGLVGLLAIAIALRPRPHRGTTITASG
jgi:NADPH:quinone reductase-like Zn-dependent oxidoreductase